MASMLLEKMSALRAYQMYESGVTYVMQTCPHPGRAARSCAAARTAAEAKRVNEAFMVVVDGDVIC